jgi:RNA polymerase sigma factor (sigma-70 family)
MAEFKRKLRSVKANEPVTLDAIVAPAEVHPSQVEFEDEFEALLDAEGDAEFGELQIKEPAPGRATLKTWTSQDFANIYTRFRPHLERYAKRWLSNPSQIDEVVQDAFLYLMVTLPELDSEIGVLRFLKWKTRLLCLDVIRASGRAVLNSVDDYEHMLEADTPEASAALEAADDAAIVRLALSKLNPRHREVLLATMYEEKSIAEVAAQVDLSENATRQLIFRARAAFKVALIGDVDTSGMSAAAILSVAARKAGTEIQKQGAKALVSLFILVLAVGSYFSITGNGTGAHDGTNVALPEKPTTDNSADTPAPKATPSTLDGGLTTVAGADLVLPKHATRYNPLNVTTGAPKGYINENQLKKVANDGQAQPVLVYPGGFGGASANAASNYWISGDNTSYRAAFAYSPVSGISNLTFYFMVNGLAYTAYAQQPTTSVDANGHMVLTAILSDIIDSQNVVLSSTALQGANVTLVLQQASLIDGVQSAELTIAPRS